MRILFLSTALPGPEVNGYIIRNLGLLGRFVTMGDVDVLSYAVGETPADLRDALRNETVFECPPPERPSLRTKAIEALSPEGIYHWYQGFADALRERCERNEYDVIWLGGWMMAQYARVARAHAPLAKIVADVADDEIRGYRIDRAKATSKRERLYIWRQIVRYGRFERRILRHVDVTLFVSHVDAGCAQERHPGRRIEVMQNGVDTDAFRPADNHSAGPTNGSVDEPILAFEGTMDFGPNVEGALHFGRNIFPLVLDRMPEARALIIGRSPLPSVRALEFDRLEVTGTVDDVREAVLRASVFVSPLLGGIGQKNKILQAWALGMPIVATPISVSGLDARDGDNLLIAESPEAFADACVRLLRDRQERQRLGANGRATALATYSVPAKMDLVEAFVNDLVERRPTRTAARLAAKKRAAEGPDVLEQDQGSPQPTEPSTSTNA